MPWLILTSANLAARATAQSAAFLTAEDFAKARAINQTLRELAWVVMHI